MQCILVRLTVCERGEGSEREEQLRVEQTLGTYTLSEGRGSEWERLLRVRAYSRDLQASRGKEEAMSVRSS